MASQAQTQSAVTRLAGESIVSGNNTIKSNNNNNNNNASDSKSSNLVQFESSRHMTFRPVVFQPNGSFKVLKETGKLRCEPHEAEIYKGRNRNELADTLHYIPGYTGFIRGAKQIAGRTFGDTTRRALTQDYRDIVCQSPVPSSPQNNRKVPQKPVDTFASSQLPSNYHIPGYTGFVPGVKNTLGRSYGSATSQELSKSRSLSSSGSINNNDGFASTSYSRQKKELDSNPLPGGSVTNTPPEMYVPAHLRYLRYMS